MALGLPIVAVSLVDENRQWFKSIQGLPVTQTPREISFCGHAILEDEVMVVEDALEDERFRDNPLVSDDPRIRFYAGQPLLVQGGRNVGTLCIIDRKPRKLTDQEKLMLKDLAALAQTELDSERMSRIQLELISKLQEAEKRALLDSLTLCWNRAGILAILEKQLAQGQRRSEPVAVVIADIDHFKAINDAHCLANP